MALTKKQMELDRIKWEISESLGVDMCGSFEFCPLCNKDVENPCDKAYKKFKRKNTVKRPLTSTEIGGASKRVGEEKAIEMVAKAGFDAWDFSMFNNVVTYDWSRAIAPFADHPLARRKYVSYAKKLKRIGEDNGIICNQAHAPFPTNCKQVKDVLKRCLELSAVAGAKVCVIHPDNQSNAQENAQAYLELLPFAKQVGVKIATENMWNYDHEKGRITSAACSHHDDFLAHIKAVNDDYLVACLDIGHAEMAGLNTSAVQMIQTLGKHLQALHIHDNDKINDTHWLPYEMQIDFVPIIKALKQNGYSGDFTMEAESYVARIDNVQEGLNKLANVAKKMVDEFIKA